MYRNILVAYDGSPGSQAALARAETIATEWGGGLTLVQSVSGGALSGGPSPEEIASARRTLEREIERLNPEIGPDLWVVGGPAGTAILTTARDIEADLIVTGSRHRGTVSRTILGSVSSELVHNATCDVLVVHPVEDEA